MKQTTRLDRASESRLNTRNRNRATLLLAGAVFALGIFTLPVSATAAAMALEPESMELAEAPVEVMSLSGLGITGLVMGGLLREEEKDPTDGGSGSGGGDPTDPDAKAGAKDDDNPKLPMGQRLKAAIASKADLLAKITERDGTISEQAATIERMTTEASDLQAKLDEANGKITQLEADAAEVEQALKSAEEEAAAEKGKNSTVEKKAQEKVASLGFPASNLPAADDTEAEDDLPGSRAELEAAMDKLETAQERVDLLNRYKKAQAEAKAG